MKVKVFRKDKEVGWFKRVDHGANAIINSCKTHGFDITEFYFTDFEDTKKIVWKGEKSMIEGTQVV